MSCDFSTYTSLRDATRDASAEAAQACTAVQTAEAALADAEQTLADANAAKTAAYAAWEAAERAENAEAARLGINPSPTPPPA